MEFNVYGVQVGDRLQGMYHGAPYVGTVTGRRVHTMNNNMLIQLELDEVIQPVGLSTPRASIEIECDKTGEYRHNGQLFYSVGPVIEPEPDPEPQGPGETGANHAARVRDYELRKSARVERYETRAENAANRSNAAYQASHRYTDGIPFGQPILVGHHSEGKHRNALKKSWNAMGRSVEEQRKAEYWAGRAASAASNHAISSDDPDAPAKLREKLEKLEANQAKMKAANAAIRKGDDAALIALGFTAEQIAELKKPDFCGRIGFPAYALTNNNAEIRRARQRLEDAEKAATDETSSREIGAVTITDNVEENRVQIEFPDKPGDDVRAYLKGHGFKWNRTGGVWQRHRSTGAMWHAERAAHLYNGTDPDAPKAEPESPDREELLEAAAEDRKIAAECRESAQIKAAEAYERSAARFDLRATGNATPDELLAAGFPTDELQAAPLQQQCEALSILDAADAHREEWEADTGPVEVEDDDEFNPDVNPAEWAELEELARFEAAAREAGSVEYEQVQAHLRLMNQEAREFAAQCNRDFKESLEADGIDIVEHCHRTGTALHEADIIARRVGCHTANWSDERNRARRERGRVRAQKTGALKARLAQLRGSAPKAAAKPATDEKPAPAPLTPTEPQQAPSVPAAKKAQPSQPAPGNDVQQAARDYVALLTEQHPAATAKLEKSLAWQLGQFESETARFISKGKTAAEAGAMWLERAIAAFDAKCK